MNAGHHELTIRLRARIENARRNAQAFESTGHLGEALVQRAKAAGIELALDEANTVFAPLTRTEHPTLGGVT